MPRRLLSRLRRRNRGEPGTRRRIHEDAGAAPPQDERIARVDEPRGARVSRHAFGLPAVRRLPRSHRPILDDAVVTTRCDNRTWRTPQARDGERSREGREEQSGWPPTTVRSSVKFG